MEVVHSFKRYEVKFKMNLKQFKAIMPTLLNYMDEDGFGFHQVCNVYFDTDNYDLIRTSLKRPAYKEKFRLRSYGVPTSSDFIYAEIKKKYDHIVYKRRVEGTNEQINDFIYDHQPLANDQQIQDEIMWLFKTNQIKEKVYIAYDRIGYVGKDDDQFRVTFDFNLRYRMTDLHLESGDQGDLILDDNPIIMEVKVEHAIPMWMTELLSRNKIYNSHFSKYGACYNEHIINEVFKNNLEVSHVKQYIFFTRYNDAVYFGIRIIHGLWHYHIPGIFL